MKLYTLKATLVVEPLLCAPRPISMLIWPHRPMFFHLGRRSHVAHDTYLQVWVVPFPSITIVPPSPPPSYPNLVGSPSSSNMLLELGQPRSTQDMLLDVLIHSSLSNAPILDVGPIW